jgi:hypothetical protein
MRTVIGRADTGAQLVWHAAEEKAIGAEVLMNR